MTQIPHLQQTTHAPYPIGHVPSSGWYCIETAYDHPTVGLPQLGRALGHHIPDNWPADRLQTHAEQHGYAREIATPEHLAALAANFETANTEGRGLLVTINHSTYHPAENTRAAGWIKALHAEGDSLWAWIEWTPWGHEMVNNGEFVFFSTEYLYTDFIPVQGGATPRILHACTLTNNNRHKGQIPATNTSTRQTTNPKTMTNQTTTRNRCGKPATKPGLTPSAPPAGQTEGEKTNNSNDNDELATLTNTGETAPDEQTPETLLIEIAELLDLPDNATPDHLLAAIAALQTHNDELQRALAEANKTAGAATNTARYPGLLGHRRAQTSLHGHTPVKTVRINTARGLRETDAQEIALVEYRRQTLATAALEKGTPLTPGEHTSISARATRDFHAGTGR